MVTFKMRFTREKLQYTMAGIATTVTLVLCNLAQAETLKIVTTLPEFAEMARAIGGEAVDATSLLRGIEDPHRVDGTPAMVLRLAKADLVVSAGLGLETAWLNRALSRAGRPAIQPGGPGFVELGSFIARLEVAQSPTDRSQGDVHAQGNPHFNLSPRALAESANGLTTALIRARPEKKALFLEGQKKFESQMLELESEVRALLKPVTERNPKPLFIEYHREFVYFFQLYGLESIGSIEEKPGISPSSGRLAQVASLAKTKGIRRALAGTFAPRQHLRRFSELSTVPFSIVPTMTRGESPEASSIRAMQLTIARELAK